MRLLFAALIVAACFVGWMQATVSLANSGYPMPGANPQRNFKVNKPVRCQSVSNGKTTVLSQLYQYPEDSAPFSLESTGITLDDKGWGYALVYESAYYYIYRFNATDGSYDPEGSTVYTGLDTPVITHLAGDMFYFSGTYTTNVVNTTTFDAATPFTDAISFGPLTSMAPFKNDWMVKSRIQSDLSGADTLLFFRDSTRTADPSFANIAADFTGTTTQSVLIYKSTVDATEFPIVYGLPPTTGYPTVIASPTYTITLPDTYAKQVMIVGDEIIVLHAGNKIGLYKFNALTGATTMNKTYDTWNGSTFIPTTSLIYHSGKALFQLSVGQTMYWVDLASGQTLASFSDFKGVDRDFAFSNIDQTVLSIGYSSRTGNYEVTGLEFDTWKVNVRGRFPLSNDDDVPVGAVIIGDECRVHSLLNHHLYTLAPLPIQNVVPILECIDRNTRIGYFSYNNAEAKGFVIPQVDDRNNLAPGQLAPIEDFGSGRGPYFPFSYQVLLNESNSFSWTLENYVLSFTVSADLYCPEAITIVLTLTADGTFPQGFGQIVRDLFVNVTGISDNRVTLVSKKRSVAQQSTLETELEIAPDPQNNEPSPAQVVQDFNQYQFDQQAQSQPDAPANIQTSVTGKSQSTEVQGQIPPPVAQPVSSTPTTTSVPVQSTSSASTLQLMSSVVVVAVAIIAL